MKILSSVLYKRNIRVDPRRPLVKTPFLSEISMIEDKHLIFSPVFGRIYLLDEEAYVELKTSNIRKEMLDAGFFINRGMNVIPQSQRPKKLSHITIFLTGSCNLRCRYCYARGGEKPSFIDLDFVKAAVNQFTDKTKKNITISLHGGGEPTLAIDRIKQIDEFLKSQFDKVQYNIQTNGVMDEKTLDWVLNNIKGITVSIDGPPYIQDKQRPMVGNKPSSPFVEKTIKRLAEERHGVSTRATITDFSVDKQTEIVEYFHSLGITRAQLEILTECGRCLGSVNIYTKQPDFFVYMKNFFRAMELAEDYGIHLSATPITFTRFVSTFCGASGNNFSLTTDGYISSCYEAVSGVTGPDVFIYGKYDKKTGKIIINDNKLNYLRQRRVQNMPDCQNCFMKWNCGGFCNSRVFRTTGDMYKPDRKTCEHIRAMGKEFLKYRAKKDMLGTKPVLSRKEKKVSFIFSDMKIQETSNNNDLEGASLINIDLD
ncbi:MAG: radical SAM protein, partial [Candidatus Aenigmarchaeota archaeon]|nr:radical SAM protein [Candidatus Aenigmarchaeota archaeon]